MKKLEQHPSMHFNQGGQLNRYLEQLREEMHRAKRELMEKEAYISMIEETAEGLRKSYREIQTVYNLSQKIVTVGNHHRIIADFFYAVGQILPIQAGAYFRYDSVADNFFLIHDFQLKDEYRKKIRMHQTLSYYRWALKERRPIVLPETIKLTFPIQAEFSGILLPIVQGEKLIGIADLIVDKLPEEFTQRDFDLLIILSNHAATALENAQLYEAMELKTEAIANMKNYLTNILQSMSSGVLATDQEGRVALVNQNAEKLLSLKDIDPVGNNILDILPDQAGVKLFELFKKTIARENGLEDEIEIQGENDTKIPLGVKCNKLLDESGVLKGVIFVLQDLSESYELSRLKAIDELKDQLISNISHELRTPLTAIKSFSEILLNYDEDEETKREFIEIINSESDRLTRLINNILDLSKLESGTANWEHEALDIRAVIESASDSLQSLLVKKKIRIVKDFPEDIPPIFGDRDKLTQVLINLLSNAIKYSPDEGEIVISVDVFKDVGEAEAEFVKVGVHDEGPGIPKKYLETIFDKFGQVIQENGDDKPAGTGLGLTISKEIIQHLGGRIWAESRPGRGASFYFILPAMPQSKRDVDKTYEKEEVTVVQEEALPAEQEQDAATEASAPEQKAVEETPYADDGS
ncbi:MAG: PAS domain-containing protein [Calditrichaeota bacterium]|nr:MAG: PAS domain-containing protein [Calditrichota bacterium]